MVILGLDCGTKTGWCLMEDGKIIASGIEDFSKKRGESNGFMFLKFRNWLNYILSYHKPNIVVYEQAHHRGGAATEIGVNLTGRIQEVCTNLEIEYAPVHTATLKKFATGNGRAKKSEMMNAAKKLLGRDPVDDNESDAVLIAKCGYDCYD